MKINRLILTLGIISVMVLSGGAFNLKFGKDFSLPMTDYITQKVYANTVNETNSPNIKKENSADFEILPTMDYVSNAKNQVWVGTFQLIWNDLMDELVKQPVKFIGHSSLMADSLNKKSFTVNDISESAYYKIWGLASFELKKQIEKGIKEKFNETSDILDEFDFAPEKSKYFLYAMLKKDFQYPYSFDKLEDAEFKGSTGNVKYFGIKGNTDSDVRGNIFVLFYNDDNDFAVTIKSKGDDIIHLYRTDDEKTFDVLYKEMLAKSNQYTGDKFLTNEDRFKAPVIEFKKERSFDELCNKPIFNTDFMIAKALETVQFNMSETGVKLKSEAGMMTKCTSVGPQFRKQPRYFYFNNKYIVFLEEKDKIPYFAMKVEDAKVLQK